MQPVRSMTGFARERRALPAGELTVTIRTVNHRALDLHFHLPAELEPYESKIRAALTNGIRRGHVDIRIHWARTGATRGEFNRPLLDSWLQAFRQAADEYNLATAPDLNSALRMPGMWIEASPEELGAEFEAALLDLVESAIGVLNSERDREGAATAELVRAYAGEILAATGEMEQARADVIPVLEQRLRDRLNESLATVADPARLAQEAAFLADRSDIAEETSRLRIHAGQILELFSAGGETGKRLEFLAQELQREANTVLSKSSTAGKPGRKLTDLGLEVKSKIEKIREQSFNLE